MNGASANEVQTDNNDARHTGDHYDSVGVLDVLVVLAKHRKLVVGLPVAAAVLAVLYTLFLPNQFTAATKILPPQNQSSASAMVAQLGNVASLVGGGASGLKSPNELYVGMLKSRTVADNLIRRFDLQKLTGTTRLSDTRRTLEGATNIVSGKDGIITIEVDDVDPKRAADLANAYVEELLKLTQVLAVTDAAQRRLFFERQLLQAKESLIKAETVARQALEQGGLVKVDEQGRAMVETTARLRAQISVKEVQIGAMRTFANTDNPDLYLAQQELEALRREAAKMEGNLGDKMPGLPSGGKGLNNLRLLRDLKYHETVYELLARQFEVAKIDEAKESAVVQVLDPAIEPDIKSKPKRLVIVLVITFAALALAMLLAFLFEVIGEMKRDPRQAERLDALRYYATWRRRGHQQD